MGFTRLNETLGKNLIINPSFDIWQRGIGPFALTLDTAYTADRFQVTTGRTITIDRIDNDTPSFSSSKTSLRADVSSVVAVPPSFTTRILQKIEGYNIRKIKNKPFVISFNVKGNFTGNSSIALFNNGESRSYVARYPITTEWTRVSLRIKPEQMNPIDGWNLDNGIGLSVCWNLECSPDFQTTNVDQWQNGLFFGHPDDTVFGDVAGRQIFLSDIALHEGIEEISFEELMRDFGSELKLCFRYYEYYGPFIYTQTTQAGQQGYVHFNFKEMKRVPPSASALAAGYYNTLSNGVFFTNVNVESCVYWLNASNGGLNYVGANFTYMDFDSEL